MIAFKLSSRLQQMDSAVRLLLSKAFALAPPVHSGYPDDYQDRRFIPPWQRSPSSNDWNFQMENDEKLLADTDRQIADYKQHVAEQEAKLAELSAKGSPPEDAVDLLKQFKETLRIAEKQREFLLRKMRGEAH